MHRTLCAIALLCATAAHALEARDIDADGTVDAYYDRSHDLTWQARPQSFNWFVHYHAGAVAVAGLSGWQLPTVAQLDSLVLDTLGNTAESFENGTANAGPFGRWFCAETWAADLDGFRDEAGLVVESARVGGGSILASLYDYRPAWLMREGDVTPATPAEVAVSPAPEPSTWALMALGMLLVSASGLRRQRRLPHARQQCGQAL